MIMVNRAGFTQEELRLPYAVRMSCRDKLSKIIKNLSCYGAELFVLKIEKWKKRLEDMR